MLNVNVFKIGSVAQMSQKQLTVGVVGDVYCPNQLCSSHGGSKCEYIQKNGNDEHTYSCGSCLAKIQVCNAPFDKQQLIFTLLCGNGIYIVRKTAGNYNFNSIGSRRMLIVLNLIQHF